MKSLAFSSLILVLASFIAGCNKPPDGDNRYTLSKDASGRTIRLDKQTGEIAIVDGLEIRPLKNATQATAERAAKGKELEEPKSWPDVDIPQIGARASLSTAWRDGKM